MFLYLFLKYVIKNTDEKLSKMNYKIFNFIVWLKFFIIKSGK